jgi:hypothetical protein
MPFVTLGRVVLEDCLGCCGDALVEWTCRSLTGTGELCGFSGYDDGTYDPLDPAAWAGNTPLPRKWAERALDGTLDSYTGDCSSCPAGVGFVGGAERNVFTGTVTVDCDGTFGGTGSVALDQAGPDCVLVFVGDFSKTEIDAGPFGNVVLSCSGAAFGSNYEESFTLLTRTLTGCGCTTRGSAPGAAEATGTATETLGAEDTLYAALARVDPPLTPGTSCCAETTSTDLTEPESIDPVAITGTAVELDVTVSGDPSTDYLVTLYFRNETTAIPPVVGAYTSLEIPVTTDGAGVAAFTVDIPQPAVGYRRCITFGNAFLDTP